MENTTNNSDGQFVVIQGGQRVTAPTQDLAEAQREADRRNQLAESTGQAIPEKKRASVKRNLCG